MASRVTAILLAFHSGGTHSLTEIARVTGLPVSTTHRLLGELTSRRVLERTHDGDSRIGLPLRMIGEAREPDHASLLDSAATRWRTLPRLHVPRSASACWRGPASRWRW